MRSPLRSAAALASTPATASTRSSDPERAVATRRLLRRAGRAEAFRLALGPVNGEERAAATAYRPAARQWWNWVARQKIDPHLPIHGLRDCLRPWVYEEYGVKQAQEWLGHSDPATTLCHYVRLTTAARAKAVAGLDEVTRAALERAEEQVLGTRGQCSTTSSRSQAVAHEQRCASIAKRQAIRLHGQAAASQPGLVA